MSSNLIDGTILVTGPEHSGTGLVADILREWGLEVLHRAMPHVDEHGCEIWWMPQEYDADAYVVIRRNIDYYDNAAAARGKSDGLIRAMKAEVYLSYLPQQYKILYDALVWSPEWQLKPLAKWLGIEYTPYSKEIYDGNEKYRRLDMSKTS